MAAEALPGQLAFQCFDGQLYAIVRDDPAGLLGTELAAGERGIGLGAAFLGAGDALGLDAVDAKALLATDATLTHAAPVSLND